MNPRQRSPRETPLWNVRTMRSDLTEAERAMLKMIDAFYRLSRDEQELLLPILRERRPLSFMKTLAIIRQTEVGRVQR